MMPSEDRSSTGYDLLIEEEKRFQSSQKTYARSPYMYIACITTSLVFIILTSTIWASFQMKTSDNSCVNPSLRQEWRTLSLGARHRYLAAVQCLSRSPSRMGLKTSRYDDFVYSHIAMFNTTHRVAISLPWHRWYIQQYEDALRNECGYDGYLAYWDWSLDATDPIKSPIWSVESGFGGNGTSQDNCVEDGVLAQLSPQYPEPHCLRREFAVQSLHGRNYTAAIVEDLVSGSESYHEFRSRLEDGPHNWVHRGIGGEMPMPWSTNDPIFFVHHAQIDRIWWKWQHRKADGRVRDYDAMEKDLKNHTGVTAVEKMPVSLEDRLELFGIGEDKLVKDVMSTESSLLCYKYPTA